MYAAERIGEEAFGGDRVEVQVTTRHAVAADVDFARDTKRYGLKVRVEQVDARVGHRCADARIAVQRFEGYVACGARNGGLGRAVGVDQFGVRWADLFPHLQFLRGERVASDVDQAHVAQLFLGQCRVVVPFGGQGVPVGSGQVQEGWTDIVLGGPEDVAAWREGRTRDQRREDFFHRQIEVQRVLLQHGVGICQAE
ncbi:hypothetical protein FX983_06566 [Pseudomonas frederiksbergensis]|uniref:Uncharacterized protein n=1 Tax=Pseudomonas frederiksbergensis TaxID=104087 RepID=A0A6L5BL42_9PSED|nr:hypothetical protein FX983_06566 [Pseudomonas frederiksbergensis]